MADWKGLSINESRFLGRVVGEPQIVKTTTGECAWISLSTKVRELSANGQWIDTEQVVPLLVIDTTKVETVKKYIQAGKEISVKCYYKSWTVEGASCHGLVVIQIDLGRSVFTDKTGETTT